VNLLPASPEKRRRFPIAGGAKQEAQSGHCRPHLCRAEPSNSSEEDFEGELRLARTARPCHAPEVFALGDVGEFHNLCANACRAGCESV